MAATGATDDINELTERRKDVMSIVLSVIAILFYVFLGAWFISDAINNYKEGKYFRCGLNIMFAVTEIICVANIYLSL